MAKVFKNLGIYKRFKSTYSKNIVSRLRQKGLITVDSVDGRRSVAITSLGRKRLEDERKIQKRLHCIKHRRSWDGRWRIVIFDIPEKFRKIRDQVRFELRDVGFVQLQKSVWVAPYHCEDFVALLRADLHIGKGLLYLVADSIEQDRDLRKHFNL